MRNLSYENEFYMKFHFHTNDFALRLALKQRHKGTRKWPIQKGRGASLSVPAKAEMSGERKVQTTETNPAGKRAKCPWHSRSKCECLVTTLVTPQNCTKMLRNVTFDIKFACYASDQTRNFWATFVSESNLWLFFEHILGNLWKAPVKALVSWHVLSPSSRKVFPY